MFQQLKSSGACFSLLDDTAAKRRQDRMHSSDQGWEMGELRGQVEGMFTQYQCRFDQTAIQFTPTTQ